MRSHSKIKNVIRKKKHGKKRKDSGDDISADNFYEKIRCCRKEQCIGNTHAQIAKVIIDKCERDIVQMSGFIGLIVGKEIRKLVFQTELTGLQELVAATIVPSEIRVFDLE